MTFLWILLGIVYIACWVYFDLATFRKGHYWLFWIGFLLPFLWIIGALIAPTPTAAARAWALRRTRDISNRGGLMRTTTSRDGRAATPRSKEGGGGGGAASVGGKRVARGEAARAQVPRATHAAFEPSPTRADPVELLDFSKACAEQNERDFRRLDAAVDSGELVARTVGRRNPDRRHRHEHTPGPCRPRRGACAPPATSSARKGQSRSFPIRGTAPRDRSHRRGRARRYISLNTVKTRTRELYPKLGATS